MADQFTVADYVALRRAELELFEKYWADEHAKNPEHYPATFDNVSDWFEQEIAFLEIADAEAH